MNFLKTSDAQSISKIWSKNDPTHLSGLSLSVKCDRLTCISLKAFFFSPVVRAAKVWKVTVAPSLAEAFCAEVEGSTSCDYY